MLKLQGLVEATFEAVVVTGLGLGDVNGCPEAEDVEAAVFAMSHFDKVDGCLDVLF